MTLATLILLTDGRLPSGGHAHSGGLEEAVGSGAVKDLATLRAWLAGRLATAGRVDAAFAAAACQPGPRWSELSVELAARTPSQAQRHASGAQGRGLLRVGRRCWPGPASHELAGGLGPKLRDAWGGGWPWPLALGAVAADAGLQAGDAAVAAAAAAISGPGWAATRLLGLDPFGVAEVLASLSTEAEDQARSALAVVEPAQLPAQAAPMLEIGAESHHRWEVRLFAS